MTNIGHNAIEILERLELDLLDRQITALHEVEHDLIVHARKREHAEAVCGLLNFLSEFYESLRRDAKT
ncbi:MAG: hypothetical protein KY475_06520 [Planctomycetes bacterium]|nr:hypothetical protein [Planctomycetota bacterium]